jgi:hypothetical protein
MFHFSSVGGAIRVRLVSRLVGAVADHLGVPEELLQNQSPSDVVETLGKYACVQKEWCGGRYVRTRRFMVPSDATDEMGVTEQDALTGIVLVLRAKRQHHGEQPRD